MVPWSACGPALYLAAAAQGTEREGEGAGGDRKRSFQVYSDPQSGRVGPLNRVREGNEGR